MKNFTWLQRDFYPDAEFFQFPFFFDCLFSKNYMADTASYLSPGIDHKLISSYGKPRSGPGRFGSEPNFEAFIPNIGNDPHRVNVDVLFAGINQNDFISRHLVLVSATSVIRNSEDTEAREERNLAAFKLFTDGYNQGYHPYQEGEPSDDESNDRYPIHILNFTKTMEASHAN